MQSSCWCGFRRFRCWLQHSNVEACSSWGTPRAARCVIQCLSRMRGNSHVRFLGEGVLATAPPYPTRRPSRTQGGRPARWQVAPPIQGATGPAAPPASGCREGLSGGRRPEPGAQRPLARRRPEQVAAADLRPGRRGRARRGRPLSSWFGGKVLPKRPRRLSWTFRCESAIRNSPVVIYLEGLTVRRSPAKVH